MLGDLTNWVLFSLDIYTHLDGVHSHISLLLHSNGTSMSSINASGYPGMTPPLLIADPSPRDLELSERLEQTLRDHDLFESDEEAQTR